jgi:RNA polymerase sigma-70 factor (ECF subfamily)
MKLMAEKPKLVDGREDAELIASIAQSRDEHAFAELLRRYEHDAFSVAYHITGSRESAEEMVQDAMLIVWKSAATFRGEGQVRNWLLRIVSRRCIRLIRSRKGKPVKIDGASLPPGAEHSTHSAAESNELADALRREFNRLPELERQLVALRFAGGLTQEEISAELSIPQQTVSYRISQTLQQLRANLVSAGHDAAVPLLAGSALPDALSSGMNASAGLRANILKACSTSPSFRQSNASQPSRASQWGLRMGVATVAAAVAAGAMWISQSAPTPPVSPKAPVANTPNPVPLTAGPAAAAAPPQRTGAAALPTLNDWHRHWTFEHGMPEDLTVIRGQWTWNQKDQTIESIDGVQWYPKYRLPAEPLEFTIVGKCLDLKQTVRGMLELFNGARTAQQSNLWQKSPHLVTHNITFKLYLYHRKFVALSNGELCCSLENDLDPENTAAIFLLQNIAVHDIIVTPLKDNEIPDIVRNPEHYMKK